MLGFLDDLFARLEDVSSSQWFYLVIAVIALLDSVIPVVPSETAVIIGGIAAGQGHLNIGLVIAAGAVGAAIGDNTAYAIGRRFSLAIRRWYDRKPKRARKLQWATDQLRRRGGSLLLTARFIPGGRTIITLTSGITRQGRARFIVFVLIACSVWATYSAGLGYLFGNEFENDNRKALLFALGMALSITLIVELIRHRVHQRRERATLTS